MWQDEIVEEVRRLRLEHAGRFGFDLRAIVAALMLEEQQEAEAVVILPPRPAQRTVLSTWADAVVRA